MVTASGLGQALDLAEYFRGKFETAVEHLNSGETGSAEILLFQILSSCIGTLSVVLDHELKNFYVGFVSKNILPLFTQLAEKSLPQFLTYLALTIKDALNSDDKLVIGVSKILSAVSGSEIFTDHDSETNLIIEVLSILERYQTESGSFQFNRFVRISDGLLAALHRNNFKLPSTIAFASSQVESLSQHQISSKSDAKDKLAYLIQLNKVLVLASGNKEIKLP